MGFERVIGVDLRDLTTADGNLYSPRGGLQNDGLTSGQGQNQTNNPNMTGRIEVKSRDDLTQRERGVQ